MVLDRPRHEELIGQIRASGARIRLIPDGDLSAGIAAAVRGAGVDAVMGTGGAPEGVITAAALRCLSGEMVARLVVNTPELEKRVEEMGIRDPKRVYTAHDLAPGKQIVFAACGSDRRSAAPRRPILRRRLPHAFAGDDVRVAEGAVYRYGPHVPGAGAAGRAVVLIGCTGRITGSENRTAWSSGYPPSTSARPATGSAPASCLRSRQFRWRPANC